MAEKKKTKPGKQNPPPLSHPPTSADVARLANVSRATVSYVLNEVESAHISEATKARVLEAAAGLGYIPHKIASSLRSGHSDLVLLPFFNWPYNHSSITFLQEMALRLDDLGYSVLLRFFGRSDKKSLARKLASFHPIGVLVGSDELSMADIDLLTRNGVKAILSYDDSTRLSIPSFSLDFIAIGECVGNHFNELGYHHIAAIVPRDKRILATGLKRLAGLERAGKDHGLTIERVDLGYDTGEARALAEKWKLGPRPRAVFTYNDEYGLLLMGALQDAGLSIPAEIALVGCDDLPLCEMVRPRITSVNLAPDQHADKIATYFHRMIVGEQLAPFTSIPLPYHIVIRDSG